MDEAGLKKQILATVVYYNELDYPLTAFEVWKYRINITTHNSQPVALSEVMDILESVEIRRWIESWRGFYFLKGRKELVNSRIDRNKIAVIKLKKLNRIVFWLRSLPFVRMIAVTGRLAMKNAEIKSDLDLLIVLRSGRIWIGRTLVTLFSHLIGKRRYADKIRDRVCLNHFMTEDALDLENGKKSLAVTLFSSGEYYFSRALFGQMVFAQFQTSNGWIEKFHPNFFVSQSISAWATEDGKVSLWLKKIGEQIFDFDWLEKKLGIWEKARIENNPKTHQEGSFVEANCEHLIFLPVPQGEEILERFMIRIETLIDKNKTTY